MLLFFSKTGLGSAQNLSNQPANFGEAGSDNTRMWTATCFACKDNRKGILEIKWAHWRNIFKQKQKTKKKKDETNLVQEFQKVLTAKNKNWRFYKTTF